MDALILEQSAAICGLGALNECVADLVDGESAVCAVPHFDSAATFAPFANPSLRIFNNGINALKPMLDFSDLPLDTTLFLYCSAKGDIASLDPEFSTIHSASPLLYDQALAAQELLGIRCSRTLAISNACASGAVGLEVAKELVGKTRYTHAVLIGFDVLSRFVVSGFAALNALSPTGARPFDTMRNGLSMGECVCGTVLSFRKPFEGDIVIAGAGSSNDANHRTGPSRTGEGLLRAAQSALHDAAITPSQIGAVKCHGTATPYNDAMEAKAIHSLFGDVIPPCASFKGAIGHCSGAGSLLEVAIAAECLKRHTLPPTCGFEALGVDEQIPVANTPQPIAHNSMLCLSAGFGGINAAVVLTEFIP